MAAGIGPDKHITNADSGVQRPTSLRKTGKIVNLAGRYMVNGDEIEHRLTRWERGSET
jgi:hypothetical protein